MDEQLGRLVQAFDAYAARHGTPAAIVVTSDHGEGLGDHGELQHGNLLYQSTMHVPLVVVGPGTAAAVEDDPVSTRRVFHTILDWAGLEPADQQRYSLAASAGLSRRSLGGGDLSRRSLGEGGGEGGEVVLGEAMKPFLGYGWQPQIMAVEGRHKAILAGKTEVYDVIADPAEAKNLGAGSNLSPALRKALDDYPVPSPEAARAPENLSDEARRNLASLGYVSASAPPVVRKDAPRPADMVGLFDTLEKASGLFVAGAVRAGHSAPREDPRGRSLQPRCGAAPGDGALVARSGREGARRVQAGRRDCAAVARRSHLPGPALRSRQGLAAGRAAPRAHRRRQSRTPSGGRGAGLGARTSGAD